MAADEQHLAKDLKEGAFSLRHHRAVINGVVQDKHMVPLQQAGQPPVRGAAAVRAAAAASTRTTATTVVRGVLGRGGVGLGTWTGGRVRVRACLIVVGFGEGTDHKVGVVKDKGGAAEVCDLILRGRMQPEPPPNPEVLRAPSGPRHKVATAQLEGSLRHHGDQHAGHSAAPVEDVRRAKQDLHEPPIRHNVYLARDSTQNDVVLLQQHRFTPKVTFGEHPLQNAGLHVEVVVVDLLHHLHLQRRDPVRPKVGGSGQPQRHHRGHGWPGILLFLILVLLIFRVGLLGKGPGAKPLQLCAPPLPGSPSGLRRRDGAAPTGLPTSG
eukprot:RCo000797